MIEARELVAYCDRYLDAPAFSDYAPNGLQVEGERAVSRIVTGVTASAALIAAAIREQADAVLVHHGWFWKGENPCLTGIKGHRARLLLGSGASLIAYHLPLDAHPEVGNNATLGERLGFVAAVPTAIGGGLVWRASLAAPMSPEVLAAQVSERLGRQALLVPGGRDRVGRIAWCSGGGQHFIEACAELDVDAFLSGEISEQTTHQARELGISYLAAGHHATERYGVAALGSHLAARYGLEHRFVDVDNPA